MRNVRPPPTLLSTAALLFLLFRVINAFNITEILNSYADYSQYNSLLSQAGVAAEINARQTITVLVVKNSAMSALTSLNSTTDVIGNVLRIHVLLGYFETTQLNNLVNGTTLQTTLFQTTGAAPGMTGFMNITDLSNGAVGFGTPGTAASDMALFQQVVYTDPYNISVLEISKLIIPSSVVSSTSPAPQPPASPSESPAPAASTPASSPPISSLPAPQSAESPNSAPKASPPPSENATPAPSEEASPPPSQTASPPVPEGSAPSSSSAGEPAAAPANGQEQISSAASASVVALAAAAAFIVF